jgi:hypothetical protein
MHEMTPQEILTYLKAEPFRPFRIRMNSGRTYEIRHPEMVRVGAFVLIIFTFVSDNPDVFDKWESVSLSLIESISHLQAPVA